MYKLKFEQGRFRVKTARCGQTALDLLRDFWPDVVLMDMHLPFLSGLEAVERLQNYPLFSRPKIILTSNLDEEQAAKKFGHLGIDGYILKANHTPSEILGIVQGMIGATA